MWTGAVFAALGLAADMGRLFIAKNEAQSYSDAAAIAAAFRLNGTAEGLASADKAAALRPNKWNFVTANFSGTTVEFSADGSTGWADSASAAPARMKYARVTTFVNNAPLFSLPGASRSGTLKAVAIAAQVLQPVWMSQSQFR